MITAVFVAVVVGVLVGVAVSVGVAVAVCVCVGVGVDVSINNWIVVLTRSVLIPSRSAINATLFTDEPESVLNATVRTSSLGSNVPFVAPATN
jgi:hypothetical protein